MTTITIKLSDLVKLQGAFSTLIGLTKEVSGDQLQPWISPENYVNRKRTQERLRVTSDKATVVSDEFFATYFPTEKK